MRFGNELFEIDELFKLQFLVDKNEGIYGDNPFIADILGTVFKNMCLIDDFVEVENSLVVNQELLAVPDNEFHPDFFSLFVPDELIMGHQVQQILLLLDGVLL